MANYAEIDIIVESTDYLQPEKGGDIDPDTAMALACDMAEMVKHCESNGELFHLASEYFGDRLGVMDEDVMHPRLQAHRTVIQHQLFMVLAHIGTTIGFRPDDVKLQLEWKEAGCAVSFGLHKDLSPKKMKVIGKLLGAALESAVDEINDTFSDGDDAQIDDDVAKALEAIGWDKRTKGEA